MRIPNRPVLSLGLILLRCSVLSSDHASAPGDAPGSDGRPPQQLTEGLRLEVSARLESQGAKGPWQVEVSILNTTEAPVEILEPFLPEGRSVWITLLDSQNAPAYATPVVKGTRYAVASPCLLPAGHRLSATLTIADEECALTPGTYSLQATYQPRGQAGVLHSALSALVLTEPK